LGYSLKPKIVVLVVNFLQNFILKFCCDLGNKIATSLTNNNEIQQIAMAPPNFELEHFIDLKIGNATTNINF
jgi:hypothetical protein